MILRWNQIILLQNMPENQEFFFFWGTLFSRKLYLKIFSTKKLYLCIESGVEMLPHAPLEGELQGLLQERNIESVRAAQGEAGQERGNTTRSAGHALVRRWNYNNRNTSSVCLYQKKKKNTTRSAGHALVRRWNYNNRNTSSVCLYKKKKKYNQVCGTRSGEEMKL